jgi:hypothetical protein
MGCCSPRRAGDPASWEVGIWEGAEKGELGGTVRVAVHLQEVDASREGTGGGLLTTCKALRPS